MSLANPTQGPITSQFGPRNLSNDYAYWHIFDETAAFDFYLGSWFQSFHAGMDFAPPFGTEIFASEAGTVFYADWAPGFGAFAGGGKYVDVLIYGGMHYVSCHMDEIFVTPGQIVARGDPIGRVGATGNAIGAHDHFALYTNNPFRLRNPAHYLSGGKYANSPLIQPFALPSTDTEAAPVWFNLLKPAGGTIGFRKGTHVYDQPGHAVGTVTSPSNAPRIASLLDTDGKKYAAYVLGTGGIRLVLLSEVTIS